MRHKEGRTRRTLGRISRERCVLPRAPAVPRQLLGSALRDSLGLPALLQNATGQSIVRCPARCELTNAPKGDSQRARRPRSISQHPKTYPAANNANAGQNRPIATKHGVAEGSDGQRHFRNRFPVGESRSGPGCPLTGACRAGRRGHSQATVRAGSEGFSSSTRSFSVSGYQPVGDACLTASGCRLQATRRATSEPLRDRHGSA